LQLTRIDFHKTGLIICSYFIFILRFEKMQLERVGEGLKGLKALQPKKWEGSSLAAL